MHLSNSVSKKNITQFGSSPHDESDSLFYPVHWFQVMDDVAVFTTNDRENQLLLNCFSKWC